ncbi:MAG: hypothetical protein AAF222_13405 [Pseudomonadota bacterium]
MNMLSNLPVFLLFIVMVWFLWPLVADPIIRRRGYDGSTDKETGSVDRFRVIAKHAAPKHELARANSDTTA